MESTVTEIHEYPLRPGGYVEPLFGSAGKDQEVMEHFLQAPWLDKASEYAVQTSGYFSGSGRSLAEPLEVRLFKERGRTMMRLRPPGDGTGSYPRRRVRRCSVSRLRSGAIRRVLESWREVCGWWEKGGGRDLIVYRIELSSGAIVDLARDLSYGGEQEANISHAPVRPARPGRWLLVGIPD